MGRMDSDSRQRLAYKASRKRAALESMGGEYLQSKLNEIYTELEDVEYLLQDDENLLDALEGNDDRVTEFQLLFADLRRDTESLSDVVNNWTFDVDVYDDCTVGLMGVKQRLVGYDEIENDYTNLTYYESMLAQSNAQKRIMRLTKQEMLNTIGFNVSVFLAFYDLVQRYDTISDTLAILKGESVALGAAIREINDLYEEYTRNTFNREAERKLDRLLALLPDRVWLE